MPCQEKNKKPSQVCRELCSRTWILPCDVNEQHMGGRKNVGIVYIEAGQVTKENLAHNFSLIYKTNWPWHVRKLDEWTYLVKFPPHIPVEQVASYPNFGLPELVGVVVNVENWDGTLEHYAELQTVWLKLYGVAPTWVEWSVLEQFASVLGTLVDVDWQGNFKSFFEVVRTQIRCKDSTKIPPDRVFGIGAKLFKNKIEVEPPSENNQSEDLLEEDTDKETETEKQDHGKTAQEPNVSNNTPPKHNKACRREMMYFWGDKSTGEAKCHGLHSTIPRLRGNETEFQFPPGDRCR